MDQCKLMCNSGDSGNGNWGSLHIFFERKKISIAVHWVQQETRMAEKTLEVQIIDQWTGVCNGRLMITATNETINMTEEET